MKIERGNMSKTSQEIKDLLHELKSLVNEAHDACDNAKDTLNDIDAWNGVNRLDTDFEKGLKFGEDILEILDRVCGGIANFENDVVFELDDLLVLIEDQEDVIDEEEEEDEEDEEESFETEEE